MCSCLSPLVGGTSVFEPSSLLCPPPFSSRGPCSVDDSSRGNGTPTVTGPATLLPLEVRHNVAMALSPPLPADLETPCLMVDRNVLERNLVAMADLARDHGLALRPHVAVLGVDMRLTASSGVKLHIGNDNYELGEKLADELMRRLPPDATGTVVLGNTSPGLAGFVCCNYANYGVSGENSIRSPT